MTDSVAVIFANEAFYAAFAARDIAAMNAVWSRRDDVTCIHPGWPPVVGHAAVIKSWRSILLHPAAPQITCHQAQARVFGDIAYVMCYERISDTFLIATNIFVREGHSWRLVHHQAGATPAIPLDEAADQPPPMQ
ncbi:MAG: nuclear transport factor 2 family protein [Rhodospirillales bacterium]|nr:nuclear transport factor 2 family protein [Rhodospirillales bacterium]